MNRRRTQHSFPPTGKILRACIAALLLLSIFSQSKAHSSPDEREYKIKAVFLFNFVNYISWPEPQKPVRSICVYGNSPFNGTLEYIRDKKYRGQVEIHNIQKKPEAVECDILYIPKEHARQVMDLIKLTQSKPILTVSDAPTFAQKGGGIEFFTRDSRIYIFMNYSALKQAQLKASSKLLELAEVVGR